MFTGIVETMATVTAIKREGSNVHYTIQSFIAHELQIDQSVAHNGVCLTVVAIEGDCYTVTAVAETLQKTNLAAWKTGSKLNIERAMKLGDRLDGHIVQGHVDATAECIYRQELEGSWQYKFRFPKQFAPLVIEKGSICINGVSLTAFNVGADQLTITIIPYTYEHTNFSDIQQGSIVNMEFDVLGKYMLRMKELENI